jgi:hypothetical protein
MGPRSLAVLPHLTEEFLFPKFITVLVLEEEKLKKRGRVTQAHSACVEAAMCLQKIWEKFFNKKLRSFS